MKQLLPVAMGLGLGCGPVQLSDVTASPAPEVQTALVATWASDRECVGSVTYAADGEATRETAPEPEATRAHRRILLNLAADQDVAFTVHCAEGGEPVSAEGTAASTGSLPPSLADLLVEGEADEGTDVLLMPTLGADTAAVVFDLRGRVVWYHVEGQGMGVTRERLSVDGESILYMVAPYDDDATGDPAIVRVGFDGEELTRYHVLTANHDFEELAAGTIAAIVNDKRPVAGEDVVGNALKELAPDGTTTTVWSTFDSFDPLIDASRYPTDAVWTHANALDYDPKTNRFWLGLRNLDAIVQIDRETGELTGSVGGPRPTFPFADAGDAFAGQHQFQWLDDGFLVFDNSPVDRVSHPVEYALDAETGVLTKRWEYLSDPAIWNFALGDVERDEAGGTRVTYSPAGVVEQLNADDTVRWRMSSPLGIGFGYAQRVAALP